MLADIPATGWRLPDDACALLAQLVAEHRPELIVECGSGRSTVVLAEAAWQYGGRVVALEDSEKYWHQTNALLSKISLRTVSLRFAPIDDGWYDRREWDDLYGIGMLVVDGPPGGSSPYARAPALPLLRDRLLPGCVVVLDDVNRDIEKKIMRQWGIKMTLFKHAKATLGYGIFDG